ncbi:MAG: hypothetical protein L6V93_07900 [Clostridiales bacterium]|nr:MAG: hypothetical protein L6V93_07900 [Clostridiales bacterium]
MLTKISVELAAGNDILQICDDKLYPTYEGNGCLATYKVFSDFGVDIKHTGDDSEIVKIPFFRNKGIFGYKIGKRRGNVSYRASAYGKMVH